MHEVRLDILVFSTQRLLKSIHGQWFAIQSFIQEGQSFLSREIPTRLYESPQSLLIGVVETVETSHLSKKLVNFCLDKSS